jgi:hypothetical protein
MAIGGSEGILLMLWPGAGFRRRFCKRSRCAATHHQTGRRNIKAQHQGATSWLAVNRRQIGAGLQASLAEPSGDLKSQFATVSTKNFDN